MVIGKTSATAASCSSRPLDAFVALVVFVAGPRCTVGLGRPESTERDVRNSG
jgi:hypothetical protein